MGDDFDSIKKPKDIFDSWSLSTEKGINELCAVETLLEVLAIDATGLSSVGDQSDPPDCLLNGPDGIVGIEVCGLIHQKARKLTSQSRRARISATDGLWRPDPANPEFAAVWDRRRLHLCLSDVLSKKERKIESGKRRGTAATRCQSFWLLIHSDEAFLDSKSAERLLDDLRLRSTTFERVFLLLSYEPGLIGLRGGGYPMFELT